MVVQGDVESIASKNPKELTGLFEQISGSEELKKDYEELEVQKARAEETTVFMYQKRKTVAAERRQKKEQKEEAEKHLRLQGELVGRSCHWQGCLLEELFRFRFQSSCWSCVCGELGTVDS